MVVGGQVDGGMDGGQTELQGAAAKKKVRSRELDSWCMAAGLQGCGDVTVDYPGQDELLLNLSCRPGFIYSHLSGLAECRETLAARTTSHLEEQHNHYHHTDPITPDTQISSKIKKKKEKDFIHPHISSFVPLKRASNSLFEGVRWGC